MRYSSFFLSHALLFATRFSTQDLHFLDDFFPCPLSCSGVIKKVLLEALAAMISSPLFDFGRIWRDAVAAVFLHPYGLKNGMPFTWDAVTAGNVYVCPCL